MNVTQVFLAMVCSLEMALAWSKLKISELYFQLHEILKESVFQVKLLTLLVLLGDSIT